MNYQLQNLSPPEFTQLVTDLLSAELGYNLSKTLDGPDGGIDIVRAGPSERPEFVVQCKHYIKSPYSHLKRDLKKEIPKVRRIQPQRYSIATSVQLTLNQKEEIKALFEGYLKSTDDVFALQDIQTMLARYPQVERRHCKLWIGSTALLTQLLHEGTSVWREELMSRLEDSKKVYVQTPSFLKAMEVLSKHRIALIAGGPGVGKTTLANILCASLCHSGYEFRKVIDLEHDIKDLPSEGNIVLLYDDFLGHAVWRDTRPGSEKRLEYLIGLVERNSRFSLILTTRTYLLEDARKLSSAVELRLNAKHEVIIHVDQLTKSLRAMILYNHLYFNQVPADRCRSLTDWKMLERIIDHENFNPRIIEYVSREIPENVSELGYASFILRQLNHPSQLYEAAINDRIGVEARDILFVAYVLGPPSDLDNLYDVWKTLRKDLDQTSENKASYTRKLKALDGNLAKISKTFTYGTVKPKEGLSFFNPGVGEMVRDLLWRHDDRWCWLCSNAGSGEELVNLALCNVEARPKLTGVMHSVTLPEIWFGRWNYIVNESVGDNGLFLKCLSDSFHFGVWNERKNELLVLLSALRDTWPDPIPWSQLTHEKVPDSIMRILESIPWLHEELVNEVLQFARDTWDDEGAIELYERLRYFDSTGISALHLHQTEARTQLVAKIGNFEHLNEIPNDQFSDACNLNDQMHLGLDKQLSALEDRVAESQGWKSNFVSEPKLGEDPLSEAQVKALFLALAGGIAYEPNIYSEVPF